MDNTTRQMIDELNARVDALQAKVQDALNFIDQWRAQKAGTVEPDDGHDEVEDTGDDAEVEQPIASEEDEGPHVEHRTR